MKSDGGLSSLLFLVGKVIEFHLCPTTGPMPNQLQVPARTVRESGTRRATQVGRLKNFLQELRVELDEQQYNLHCPRADESWLEVKEVGPLLMEKKNKIKELYESRILANGARFHVRVKKFMEDLPFVNGRLFNQLRPGMRLVGFTSDTYSGARRFQSQARWTDVLDTVIPLDSLLIFGMVIVC